MMQVTSIHSSHLATFNSAYQNDVEFLKDTIAKLKKDFPTPDVMNKVDFNQKALNDLQDHPSATMREAYIDTRANDVITTIKDHNPYVIILCIKKYGSMKAFVTAIKANLENGNSTRSKER